MFGNGVKMLKGLMAAFRKPIRLDLSMVYFVFNVVAAGIGIVGSAAYQTVALTYLRVVVLLMDFVWHSLNERMLLNYKLV